MEEAEKAEPNIILEQSAGETKIDVEDKILKSPRTQPAPPYRPNQPPPQYYYQDSRYPDQSRDYQQRPGGQNTYAGGYDSPPRDVSRGQYAYPRYDRDQENDDNYYMNNNIFNDAFNTIEIRNKFVQRVYNILAVQLFFTFALVLLVTFVMSIRTFVLQNYLVISIVGMVLYLTTALALMCCMNLRRQYPTNFILLGLLTLGMTLTVCVLCAISTPIVVLAAVGTTAAVCLLVSLFACQTKWDITSCGMMLCIATLILMLYGLIISIMSLCGIYIKTLHIIYSGIGCFLFCLWLMYDTQVIVGGRRVEISPEEYIFGALTLYVDMMMIFIFIMDLYRFCLGGN